jgi:hypothetical protein
MNDEVQEPDEEGAIPDPKKNETALHGFLNKRKLQISVLKKMLETIPIEKAENDIPGQEFPKENQNP